MSPFSALIIFLLIWWTALFAILPLGVRGQAEDNNIVEGTEPGAPVESQMKRKIILTTLVSIVLWVITCAVIMSGIIDPEDFAWFRPDL